MHRIAISAEGAIEPPFWKKFEVPTSIAMYAGCSISMVILNKLMIDTYGFNFPTVLIFFQNLSAVVFVMLLKGCGAIDYPPLEWHKVKRWIPLTLLFVGMLVSSLLALKTLSVQVATLIKNMAIITTAVGDYILFKHTFNLLTFTSFLLLISGSLLGASNDAWVTAEGLLYAIVNVACTSSFQLYMKVVLNDLRAEMGRWGPVYYNNLLSLPPLLVPTVMQYSAWSAKARQDLLHNPTVIATMLVLMVASAVMTMSSFWCMSSTSPTTYGVIGGINKIPLTVIGIYIFNQFPTPAATVGIVGALAGGLLYTHAMNKQKAGDSKTR